MLFKRKLLNIITPSQCLSLKQNIKSSAFPVNTSYSHHGRRHETASNWLLCWLYDKPPFLHLCEHVALCSEQKGTTTCPETTLIRIRITLAERMMARLSKKEAHPSMPAQFHGSWGHSVFHRIRPYAGIKMLFKTGPLNGELLQLLTETLPFFAPNLFGR